MHVGIVDWYEPKQDHEVWLLLLPLHLLVESVAKWAIVSVTWVSPHAYRSEERRCSFLYGTITRNNTIKVICALQHWGVAKTRVLSSMRATSILLLLLLLPLKSAKFLSEWLDNDFAIFVKDYYNRNLLKIYQEICRRNYTEDQQISCIWNGSKSQVRSEYLA